MKEFSFCSIEHAAKEHGIYPTKENWKKKLSRPLEADATFRASLQASGKDVISLTCLQNRKIRRTT